MGTKRATRADALEKRLGLEGAIALRNQIIAGMNFRDAEAWVEENYEVETSASAMTGFNQRVVEPYLQEQLKQSAELAELLTGQFEELGDVESVFENATVAKVKQRAFEIMMNPDAGSKERELIMKWFLKMIDQRDDAARTEIAMKKVAAFEKAQAALEEGTDESGGITEAGIQKIREALKRI